MSSSDGESRFGTIFMGPTPDRETTLDRLYDAAQRETWNQQTEADYLERVKARATERVRALLLQARQRGDAILREAEREAGALRAEAAALKAEAEKTRDMLVGDARTLRDEAAALRDAAQSEGYEAGRVRAEAEVAEARRALGETTAVVLLGIHEQCSHIFEAWRDDLAALLREAVAKGTGLVVDQDRAAVLEQLLDRSMRALLDRRRLVVTVNPVDAALVTDMLADAKRGGPRVDNWELSTNPDLEPGSLVVESESGLVNNSREVRRSVVDEVLEHLTLPVGQADQDAFAAVTQTLVQGLRAHGVDLEEEGGAPDDGAAEASLPPAESAAPAPSGPDTSAGVQTPDAASAPSEPEPLTPPPAADAEPEPAPAEATPPSVAAEPAPTLDPVESAPPVLDPVPPVDTPAPAAAELSEAEAQRLVREFLDQDGRAAPGEPGLPPDVADELLADMGFAPAQDNAPTEATNPEPSRPADAPGVPESD